MACSGTPKEISVKDLERYLQDVVWRCYADDMPGDMHSRKNEYTVLVPMEQLHVYDADGKHCGAWKEFCEKSLGKDLSIKSPIKVWKFDATFIAKILRAGETNYNNFVQMHTFHSFDGIIPEKNWIYSDNGMVNYHGFQFKL